MMKNWNRCDKQFFLAFFLVLSLSMCTIPVFGDNSNQTGYYEIRANVENASVYLDGVAVGTIQGGTLLVPAEISSKPVLHQLMIQAPGYRVYNETVLQSPKAGKNLILKGILTRIPEAPTGTLYLAVSPPGADIMIDGVPRGVVDQSGITVLRGVKAGNRNILIHLDGYQDYNEWASIEANMDNKVRVTLLPLTTGSLQITSEPNAASVIISGVPAGITPVTIPDVPAGQVDVLLTLSGYQDWTGTTVVQPGQTASVSGTLIPVPVKTPEPQITTAVQTQKQTETPTPVPTTTPLSPVIGGLALIILSLFWKNRK